MIKTLDQALDVIYSHVDYSMTHAKNIDKSVFSLDNIRLLLEKIGNPQKNFAVIHVAGTKGKGSVCAMLSAALQEAGFKTGLYTSPHLIKFNERIIVNGKMIHDQDVIRLTDLIIEAAQTIPHVSTFEIMTAMAFKYFSDQKIDIAVVETGLGGRLDSTNIVDPVLSIITSISYDHTSFLGNTIEKIAGEKAGIIKPNKPVICAYQPYTGAKIIIEKTAALKKSPWIYVPDRFRFINTHDRERNNKMFIWRVEDQKLLEQWCMSQSTENRWHPTEIDVPLSGLHQLQNAAVVFAALNKLRFQYRQFNFNKALQGISKAFWPCRFEVLSEKPMLIVDGAHNNDSIDKLCSVLDRFCGTRTIKCIFGASEDKDLPTMIKKLALHVDEFIMTRSTHPRAADPDLLCRLASETGRKNRKTASLEEAYSIYKSEQDPNMCYITAGSLFAAGGIREIYMNENPQTPYFTYNEPLSE